MLSEILKKTEVAIVVDWYKTALAEADEAEVREIQPGMDDREAIECDPYAKLGYELGNRLYAIFGDDDETIDLVSNHLIFG